MSTLQPVTPGLRFDVAGRFEDYTDFGSATVGKFTARYDSTRVRSAWHHQLRLPRAYPRRRALHQRQRGSHHRLRTTSAGWTGHGLLGLGGGLKPERSTNFSFGFVLRPLENLTATIDAYQIWSRTASSAAATSTGRAMECLTRRRERDRRSPRADSASTRVLATGATGINLFANGIDTRTRGVDLTLVSRDYRFGHVDLSVRGTFNYTP